ncbi:MAG: DNA-binding protein, partial [Spirochaetota bacterium]
MFNLGEKDAYGRQKRIEHRGKYLRASRTGGVSLRAQTKAAGLNVTANTKRGIRVSTRIARRTNIGLQNGRFILRGRYGRGRTKLNLSKSGASVSTRNALGSFNWTNPNRSSAKVMGVQMRGKKAANLQLIYMLGMLLVGAMKLAFMLVVLIARGAAALLRLAGSGIALAGACLGELGTRTRALARARAGERLLERTAIGDRLRDADLLRAALRAVIKGWGAGMTIGDLEEAFPIMAALEALT